MRFDGPLTPYKAFARDAADPAGDPTAQLRGSGPTILIGEEVLVGFSYGWGGK